MHFQGKYPVGDGLPRAGARRVPWAKEWLRLWRELLLNQKMKKIQARSPVKAAVAGCGCPFVF